MWLKIAPGEALALISDIPHEHCSAGINRYWRVSDQGRASAQAVLWLFCWAKTGQGSNDAAHAATNAFNQIFYVSFHRIDVAIDHEWARKKRYAVGNIEFAFAECLKAGGIDPDTRRRAIPAPPSPRSVEFKTLSNSGREPSSILDGIDDIVERHLGIFDIGKQPRIVHLASARRLSGTALRGFDPTALIKELYAQIDSNWLSSDRDDPPSSENWRLQKQPWIASHNSSREKTLEKAIARVTPESWSNQVPTASGLISSTYDRHRNIDLVHRPEPGRYDLIELKVYSDNNNPLHAALELLQYGVLYLFSRINYTQAELCERPLLCASNVHLRVLAPVEFYRGFNFAWLESALSHGLRTVILGRECPSLLWILASPPFPTDLFGRVATKHCSQPFRQGAP